jgi:hypothetical protein
MEGEIPPIRTVISITPKWQGYKQLKTRLLIFTHQAIPCILQLIAITTLEKPNHHGTKLAILRDDLNEI